MMSMNGRRVAAAATAGSKGPEGHPGPVSLNMVIGHRPAAAPPTKHQHQHQHQHQPQRESTDTLSQLEQQVRSIEVNTMAAARLREELAHEPDAYLRYREHEDLLDTISHEPER